MADYNIKSQNTVLHYYLRQTNLDFVTLRYCGVWGMTELILLHAVTNIMREIDIRVCRKPNFPDFEQFGSADSFHLRVRTFFVLDYPFFILAIGLPRSAHTFVK